MAVRALYEQTLAERGFKADAAQLRAIDALERCENEWIAYKARRSNAITNLILCKCYAGTEVGLHECIRIG